MGMKINGRNAMGADMVIESIAFKTNKRRLIDEEWAAAALAQAREAIAAINEKRLAEVNCDPDNSYDDIESYKQDLINDLAKIELAVVGAHRQTADSAHWISNAEPRGFALTGLEFP
jgi:hypothetical protein